MISTWFDTGMVGPVDIISSTEADTLRTSLEHEIESVPEDRRADTLYYKSHLVYGAVDTLAFHPATIAVAVALLGPDVLLWDSNVPIKPALTAKRFTPHQDATYWGLEPPEEAATIWVALTPSTVANGCICFALGSHRHGQLPHRREARDDVMLRRGQELDPASGPLAPVELRPGQATAHHPFTAHASGPNGTDEPRIGVVLVYVSARVRTPGRSDGAIRVAGSENHHFSHEVRVAAPASPAALAAHAAATDAMRARVVPPASS
ncbi:MAG: phytanoyl-CoA dioxygenase family protein [Actinomycetota bacterium]